MPTHGKRPQATGLKVGQVVQNRWGDWVKVPKCLGPATVAEHGFLGNTAGERVCPRCRRMQDALRLSPTMTCPTITQGEI